jgi:hypothetical protein
MAGTPPSYFPPRYFAGRYWVAGGELVEGAISGAAHGTSSATGNLTAVGNLAGSSVGIGSATGVLTATTPVVVEPVALGGAPASRRTPAPAPLWRGGIVEIRADIVGSCVVSAEVVRHVPPADVAHVELEDDDLEVMAFVTAFLAKIANVERINGLSV